MITSNKKRVSDQEIIEAYSRLKNVWHVGEELGICGQGVHQRLKRLKIECNTRHFTPQEIEVIKKEYNGYAETGTVKELAQKLNRNYNTVCSLASKLGLTTYSRDRSYQTPAKIKNAIEWHKNNPHPKGFKDKHHSKETKIAQGTSSKERWDTMTQKERRDMAVKMVKGKNGHIPPRPHASWKCGWRIIAGHRIYFRSTWEANYGRYLQFLQEQGKIKSWEHEPETFWFEKIRRGTVSYLPDFKIIDNKGDIEYHEVKGWMDARSRTIINRMRIYHPTKKLIIIDGKRYKDIASTVKFLIDEWECRLTG